MKYSHSDLNCHSPNTMLLHLSNLNPTNTLIQLSSQNSWSLSRILIIFQIKLKTCCVQCILNSTMFLLVIKKLLSRPLNINKIKIFLFVRKHKNLTVFEISASLKLMMVLPPKKPLLRGPSIIYDIQFQTLKNLLN